MRPTLTTLALALLIGAALPSPARAGRFFAIRGNRWVGFVVMDRRLSERLTREDLFFLSHGLRRRIFRHFGPFSEPEEYEPVVVQPSSQEHTAELDRAIETLGRLIREAEQKKEGHR